MSPEHRKRRGKQVEQRNPAEYAKIISIYQMLDQLVWSAEGFPAQHSPDIQTLMRKLKVGDYPQPDSQIHLHPQLKSEYRIASQTAIAKSRASAAINDSAWHDIDGTQVFKLRVFQWDDQAIQEIAAHEAAHSVALVPQIILPAQYTDSQKSIIQKTLNLAFVPGVTIKLEQTKILKEGFRERLQVGRYDVSDIGEDDCLTLNELYALTMEIVSTNIVASGSVVQFDENIKVNKFVGDLSRSKPRFTKFAQEAIRLVGWRNILDALIIGDLDQSNAYLQGINSEFGSEIIPALALAYDEDESGIIAGNTEYRILSYLIGNILRN